jgi:hypothetical protein
MAEFLANIGKETVKLWYDRAETQFLKEGRIGREIKICSGSIPTDVILTSHRFFIFLSFN